MIDLDHGQIAYGVLSRGGLAGVGEKLFAVPMGAVRSRRRRRAIRSWTSPRRCSTTVPASTPTTGPVSASASGRCRFTSTTASTRTGATADGGTGDGGSCFAYREIAQLVARGDDHEMRPDSHQTWSTAVWHRTSPGASTRRRTRMGPALLIARWMEFLEQPRWASGRESTGPHGQLAVRFVRVGDRRHHPQPKAHTGTAPVPAASRARSKSTRLHDSDSLRPPREARTGAGVRVRWSW
jgi:hypothetical protein